MRKDFGFESSTSGLERSDRMEWVLGREAGVPSTPEFGVLG